MTVSAPTSTVEALSDLNAVSILRDAYDSALQIESTPLRSETLRFIAEAQAEANDLTGALASASMMPPPSGQGLSYSKEDTIAVVVGVRAEVGDLTGALQALTSLQNSDAVRSRALADIAAAQARNGEIEEAFQTITPIRDASDRAYAMGEIAVGQAQSGDDQSAVRTANSISDEFSRNSALKAIAVIQVSRKDIPSALRTLTHIPASHQDERNEVLWAIALGYGHAGDFEKAVQAAKSLESSRDDALLDIAEVQAQKGQAAAARKLAGLIHALWERSIGLQGIARVLMQSGYKEQATKTLHLAEQTALQEKRDDLKEHARMHCTIARAVLGDVPGALRLAKTLPNEREPHDSLKRYRALLGIAEAQAAAGDTTGAFQTAEVIYESIRSAYPETHYLTEKIQHSVRRSVWPKILKAAILGGHDSEALKRAREITDPEIKAEALLKVGEGLLERTRSRTPVPSMRKHRFGFPI